MARRQGRGGRFPRWWKGQKFLDDIGGEEIFSHDGSLFRQRGLNVSKQNFDTLLDSERQDQINNR